ncbi:hypothetical protein EV702DRAFT_1191398 [Suillus placidus]|uniref:Uncharacterized protein n=1 Tax=Suillus placidus TaxID=48579 RepID=A0A9P7A7L6_9AGAM|nr:hypothetical protein EV702DRAFT_1191398 [Suillus placidus]
MRDDVPPSAPIQHTNKPRQGRQLEEIGTAGCRWSAMDWSCAYDLVFMLMFYVFQTGSKQWKLKWEATRPLAYSLGEMYRKLGSSTPQMSSGHVFDEMHDAFRDLLFAINPINFPRYGEVGASVSKIMLELTPELEFCSLIGSVCVNECPGHTRLTNAARTRHTLPTICSRSAWVQIVRDSGIGNAEASSVSTQMWVNFFLQGELNKCRPLFASSMCPACNGDVDARVFYEEPPTVLVFDIDSGSQVKVLPSAIVTLPCMDGNVELHLRAIVYLADYHFSAQLVGEHNKVWKYDGRLDDGVPQLDQASSAAYAEGGPTFMAHMSSLGSSQAHLLVYAAQ